MGIKNSSAFTLTEVIAASVVASVILIGMMTSSMSLQKTKKYYSDTNAVSKEAQNILYSMLQDASQSVGDSAVPAVVKHQSMAASPPAPVGTVEHTNYCFNHGKGVMGANGSYGYQYNWVCYTKSRYTNEEVSRTKDPTNAALAYPPTGGGPIRLGHALRIRVKSDITGDVTDACAACPVRTFVDTSVGAPYCDSRTEPSPCPLIPPKVKQTGRIEIIVETCLDFTNPSDNRCIKMSGSNPETDVVTGDYISANNPFNPYVIKRGSVAIPGQTVDTNFL